MKNKIRTIIAGMIMLLTGIFTNAQDVDFEWAIRNGGESAEGGEEVIVDMSGNVYVIGNFEGTADFDPGEETFNLNSAGSTDNFIQKLDANGNLIWVNQIGGIGFSWCSSVALDATGNIYTTGEFNGVTDFDPGPDTLYLNSTGGMWDRDAFIQKLNSEGDLVWVKQIGGTNSVSSYDIFIDNLDNIYITGSFSGTADFDPGTGIYNLSSIGSAFSIFVLKLDALGDFVWAKQFSCYESGIGVSLSVDDYGNVYTTGNFQGTVDFDPGSVNYFLTSVGSSDIFIHKLNASGDMVWAKSFGGTNWDQCLSIAIDGGENVYTTGYFEGTVDFDPGNETHNLTSMGDSDVFIHKLDQSGNFSWVKQLGGDDQDFGLAITVDASENIYTTGAFRGTVDVDPGAGVYNLNAVGESDIFIQKLDTEGDFIWAGQISGVNRGVGWSITVDTSYNIYSTGFFEGTADFHPKADKFNLTSAGGADIFVLKLSQSIIQAVEDFEDDLGVHVYPNPITDILHLDKGENQGLKINVFDNYGRVLISKTSKDQITELDFRNFSQGFYILSVSNGEKSATIKIVRL